VAARAHAVSRPAQRAKRRPAARRRPAPRRGASRVQWDRVGRIALTFVLAAVLYSYLNPAIDFVKTYTATTEAKAQLHELLDENKRLHYSVQHADDPVFLAGRARTQGMVAEGERPIAIHGLSPAP
jgi:cell division protein FtsB